MVFYAGMGNPMGMGSFGGMRGNPTAFATPGLNPQALAILAQMQDAGGGSVANPGMGGMNPAPTLPTAPGGIGGAATNQLANLLPRVGQPGAMPGGAMPPGAGATPGQAGQNMLGGINPQMLALLQALGQGGQGGGNLGLLSQLGLAGTGAGSAPPPNQGLLGGFFNR